MNLHRIDNLTTCESFQGHDLSDAYILRAETIKIFVLIRSRNAWNSTWINRYDSMSFFFTLEDAKEHAEKLRGPGWVFTIEEKPAYKFSTENEFMLVSFINSNDFLKKYSGIFSDVVFDLFGEFGAKAWSLKDVFSGFSRNYDNWGLGFSDENQVCIHFSFNSPYSLMSPPVNFLKHISSSIGTHCHLFWKSVPEKSITLDGFMHCKKLSVYKIRKSSLVEITNSFIKLENNFYLNWILDRLKLVATEGDGLLVTISEADIIDIVDYCEFTSDFSRMLIVNEIL